MPEYHANTRARLYTSRRTLTSGWYSGIFGVFLCIHRLKIPLFIFNYVFFINYSLLHFLLVETFYCKIYHFSVTFANQKRCAAEKKERY